MYWHIIPNGYVQSGAYESKIRQHRFIMNCPSNKEVDHINGKKNDNRKKNLRICTRQENKRNVGLRANNTSGETGVYKDKARDKWFATIKLEKSINLGRFDTFEEAVKARKEAEIKYFREYRYKGVADGELSLP